MLQKLPNKTLYRKRNCWAPKKIYKNAKRVDKSKDICLPDNLSEKDFLINGDFFYCSVPKWKIAKEPTIPTVPWNPSGWLVSLFFPFSYWRREGQLKNSPCIFVVQCGKIWVVVQDVPAGQSADKKLPQKQFLCSSPQNHTRRIKWPYCWNF